MARDSRPARSTKHILLVTGMSGAGKSVTLRTLEDLGWETVDNLPLSLLERLLAVPDDPVASATSRPVAIGIDSRTRSFDAAAVADRIRKLRDAGLPTSILFLDCGGAELTRRYSETRRRHPLAPDRPPADGIARERELLDPLRRVADQLVDTTDFTSNDLRLAIRTRFDRDGSGDPVLTLMSFGYARGVPRNADLVFDMRFLDNPHWVDRLRPLTGLDAAVAAHIAADPAHDEALDRITDLLLFLLPRYRSEGKSYVTVAFGCTGGRHRSVHIAETIGQRLRGAAFSPTIVHRDMGARPSDDDGGTPSSAGVGEQLTGV
jgi:UPF0042 nucleotide-binding protein